MLCPVTGKMKVSKAQVKRLMACKSAAPHSTHTAKTHGPTAKAEGAVQTPSVLGEASACNHSQVELSTAPYASSPCVFPKVDKGLARKHNQSLKEKQEIDESTALWRQLEDEKVRQKRTKLLELRQEDRVNEQRDRKARQQNEWKQEVLRREMQSKEEKHNQKKREQLIRQSTAQAVIEDVLAQQDKLKSKKLYEMELRKQELEERQQAQSQSLKQKQRGDLVERKVLELGVSQLKEAEKDRELQKQELDFDPEYLGPLRKVGGTTPRPRRGKALLVPAYH
eukprot:NODE_3617_length_934_cov_7.260223_g3465_i0.p1 GENE.NODE_3617_length_934_cov_7.260223_g3465_i0~~NODE_3617_length_934_cov_7.260223_g3465_i0.p1  ORF type:complete len:281 (-),score=73.16 NODE_3617_length_934_cov_7.260223_g3465_i0:43-885(-)